MNINGEPTRNDKTLNGETSLGDSTAADLTISGDLTVGGTSSFDGQLDMNSAKIINLGTPTNPADSTTKAYVDSVIPDVTGFLKTDGSNAMSASLNAGTNKVINVVDPAAAQDAATKNYVDTNIPSISGLLKIDGSNAMTASLDAGTNKVINVVDPAAAQDAATKNYVDTTVPSISGLLKTDGSNAMSASLNAGTNKLINVVDPAAAQDAATKAYVDSKASPWTETTDGRGDAQLKYDAGSIKVDGNAVMGTVQLNTKASFGHSNIFENQPLNMALEQNDNGSTFIKCGLTDSVHQFITFNGNNNSHLMTIRGSDGNVGIGEEVPSYKLTVRGDGGNALRLEANDHVYMGFFPKGDTSGGRYAWFGYANSNQATDGLLTLYLEKGDNKGFKVVGGSGGTRAPLIVSGYGLSLDKRWWNFNVSAIGSVTTGSPSNANPHNQSRISVEATHGYLTNTGYLQSSDDIIKSLEKPIEVGLKEILQLEPKHYLKHPTIRVPADDETGKTLPKDEEGRLFQMTEDGEKEPLDCYFELGLISQAVEKIKGLEILVTEEINGIKNVNYVGLIPVLVKAVQELDTKRKEDASTILRMGTELQGNTKRILDLNKRLLVLEEKLKNVETNTSKEYIL